MNGPNRISDDPESSAEQAVLRGLDAVARGDLEQASLDYLAAAVDGGTPTPGRQALERIFANHQRPQSVAERAPQEWAAMTPADLTGATLELLTVAGAGGRVDLPTVRAALAAVGRMIATDEDEAVAAWSRVGWMGLAAQLEATIASNQLAAARELSDDARAYALGEAEQQADHAHLLLELIAGQLHDWEPPPGVMPFDPTPAIAINCALRGRIALALGNADRGTALLEQARNLIPAGRADHAEVLIDLAIVATRADDWQRVADLAVPALLVLDGLRHQKLLRSGRLDVVDRVDNARELAFAAAEALDDHHLLAELVCHAARFGRYLPLNTAAQPQIHHADDIAAAAGLDDPTIIHVEPIPFREWPWPGLLAESIRQFNGEGTSRSLA